MTLSNLGSLSELELPETPHSKAASVEEFITRTAAPITGFHLSIVGFLVLRAEQPERALELAGPMALLGAASLVGFGVARSSLIAPAILVETIAIMSFGSSPYLLIATIPAAAFITLMIVRGVISSYGFWWVALYLPIIDHLYIAWYFDGHWPMASLVLAGVVFGASSLIFHFRSMRSANIAAVVGFAFATALEFGSGIATFAAALAFAFACAEVWFGWKLRRTIRSDVSIMLLDGIFHALTFMGIAVAIDGSWQTDVRMWGALTVMYSMLMATRDKPTTPARICWSIVGVVVIVCTLDLDLEARLGAGVIGALVLQSIAIELRSRFAARFSMVVSLVILAVLILMSSARFSAEMLVLSLGAIATIILGQWDLSAPERPRWWMGILRDRHVVWLRQSSTKIGNLVAAIPLTASLIGLVRAILKWIEYVGPRSSLGRFDQITLVVGEVMFVAILANELGILAYEFKLGLMESALLENALFTIFGVVSFALGTKFKVALHRFVGLLFIAVPALLEAHHLLSGKDLRVDATVYYAWFALIFGACLAAVGVLRSIAKST